MDQRLLQDLERLVGPEQSADAAALVDQTNRAIEEGELVARSFDLEVEETEDAETEDAAEDAAEVEESDVETEDNEDATVDEDVTELDVEVEVEVATEEIEFELDAEMQGQLVEQIAQSPELHEHILAGVNERLERIETAMPEMLRAIRELSVDITRMQDATGDRLDALERDDEERHEEWVRDLPLQNRRVVVRPSKSRKKTGEDGRASSADVASATLAGLPTLPG